ncbi:hypothetical protein V8C35DRAFT_283968 [Trichoderma chlorosporum]
MASAKRTVIELSSDSDEYNPFVRRRKIRKRYRVSEPQRHNVDSEVAQDEPTFTDFLSRALPSKLISGDVAEYIQRESNLRLKTAVEEGITLDNVFIGMDCLPTWIGMQWDPQRESLHCAIQDRLMNLEVSSVLGDTLREDLIYKGNRRLEEARQLGLVIDDITIGEGLLAIWEPLEPNQEITHGLETPPDQERSEPMRDDLIRSNIEITVPHSSILSQGDIPESDIATISSATTVQSSPETVYDSSSTYDSCSDFSSCSGSNSIGTDDEDEVDDVIHMSNSVNPQPEYLESDGEAPHILHDVEIAGGHEGLEDVDLEVYLVEDDEEVEDLPELELAIDGDAFIHYFGDDGVMEVEIPGMDLRCLLDVPPDQDGETGHNAEGGPLFEEVDDDFDGSAIDVDEDEDEDDNGDGKEDGERNSVIQITEDGFTW